MAFDIALRDAGANFNIVLDTGTFATFSPSSATTVGLVSSDAAYANARAGTGSSLSPNSGVTNQYVGQSTSGGFSVYEGMFEFDTSALGSGATILSVAVQVQVGTDNSVQDFTLELYAYDYGTSITTADFVAGASLPPGGVSLAASLATNTISGAGPKEMVNSGTVLANAINKTGPTRLLLVSDRTRTGVQPATSEFLILDKSQAVLRIGYTPGGGATTVEAVTVGAWGSMAGTATAVKTVNATAVVGAWGSMVGTAAAARSSITEVYFGSQTETDNTPNNFSLSGTGAAVGDWFFVHVLGEKTRTSLPGSFTAVTSDTTDTILEARSGYKVLTATDVTTNVYVTLTGDPNFNGIRWGIWILRSSSGTIGVDASVANHGVDVDDTPSVAVISSVTAADGSFIMESASMRDPGTAWTLPGAPATTDLNSPTGWSSAYHGSYFKNGAGATGARNASENVGFSHWVTLTTSLKPVSVTQVEATGLGAWGGLTATATAIPNVQATPVAGAWGAMVGAATAVKTIVATPVVGAWGALTGSATATVRTPIQATTVGAWGALTGAAIADLIFGDNDATGSIVGGLADAIVATKYTLPHDGTAFSLGYYSQISGNIKYGIYANSGGVPGSLIVANNTGVAVVAGWNTVDIADTFLSAGDYWIGFLDSASSMRAAKAVGPTQAAYVTGIGYANGVPSPFGTPTGTQAYNYVCYVNYIPSGITVVEATTTGAWGSMGEAATAVKTVEPDTPLNIFVPLYVYPSYLGWWNPYYANPPDWGIVNVSGGPGTVVNSDYTLGIDTLRNLGSKLIGYVDTNYGAVSAATVKADIDLWASLYNIDGIFFDRVPSTTSGTDIAYMLDVSNYAKAKVINWKVCFNHGTYPLVSDYIDQADFSIVFEDVYTNYATFSIPGYATYVGSYPAKQWVHLILSCATEADMRAAWAKANGFGVGNFHATTDLFFAEIPSYYPQEFNLDPPVIGSWGSLTGTASAVVVHGAVAAGAWGSMTGAVSAARVFQAVTVGAWGSMVATATAVKTVVATSSGAWGALTGTATAVKTVQATPVVGAWGALTGTVQAARVFEATTVGAWGALTGTVTATVLHQTEATAAAAWGSMVGTATAVPNVQATAVGAWGAATGSATAVKTVNATPVAAWGALVGSAQAGKLFQATVSGPWGALVGQVAATVLHQTEANAAAVWGALTGTATAVKTVQATPVTGAWGALTGSVTATRTLAATTTGAWGAMAGVVTAIPNVVATATGAWGSMVATATAVPNVQATASGPWGALVGSVTAVRTVQATAVGPWGSMVGSATATIPTAEIPAVAAAAWGGIVGVVNAARIREATVTAAWGPFTAAASTTVVVEAISRGPWGPFTAAVVAEGRTHPKYRVLGQSVPVPDFIDAEGTQSRVSASEMPRPGPVHGHGTQGRVKRAGELV